MFSPAAAERVLGVIGGGDLSLWVQFPLAAFLLGNAFPNYPMSKIHLFEIWQEKLQDQLPSYSWTSHTGGLLANGGWRKRKSMPNTNQTEK